MFISAEIDEEAALFAFAAIEEFFGYSVFLDARVDFIGVVGEIAEGVEDLAQGQVGQMGGNVFGQYAKAPVLDDGSYGRAGAFDDRFAAEDFVVSDDV